MKRILMFLFAAALAWAQLPQAPQQQQAIIDVKYADVSALANMLKMVFGNGVQGSPAFHAITVTGTPETVVAVTAAVKRFDVPPPTLPDVELTVYLISGLTQSQAPDEVPQELAPTIKQLRGLFAYKSYKLADSVVLRGRASAPGEPLRGQRQAQGSVPDGRYSLSYSTLNVSSETPRVFHIQGLDFTIRGSRMTVKDGVRIPEFTDVVAHIATDLDLKEGQKTVVGKSSINPAGDALVLVIMPKVVD